MIESIITFFSNYSWAIAFIHVVVAIIMFFIINWIGSKSVSVGYMQMSMVVKDDSYPAFNFLFKAIAPVILMIVFVAIVQSIHYEQLSTHCYLIVVYYWLFRVFIIAIYGRFTLTNWKTQFLYWISSIGISLYLYRLIDEVDRILPSPEALRDQMWILILLFLYSIFNNMVIDRSGSQKRKEKYIKKSYSQFQSKYHEIIKKACNNNYFFIQIVYSIMIYENFNRPRFVRWIEYIHFSLTKKPHTLGIMQVASSKWINDTQSVILAINKIKSDCDNIVDDYAKRKEEFSLRLIVRKIAGKYNKDDAYVEEVELLFNTISDTDNASDALYKAYKHKKLKYDKESYYQFYFKKNKYQCDI